MCIARPEILDKWFSTLFPWLKRCEEEFGFDKLKGYDTLASIHAFQACALNHSAISPLQKKQTKFFIRFQGFNNNLDNSISAKNQYSKTNPNANITQTLIEMEVIWGTKQNY